MYALVALVLCYGVYVYSHPPDKVSANHIIRARSIDLSNAHGLTMEARLENEVIPTAYEVEVQPDLEQATFTSISFINISWTRDSDEINVHCSPNLKPTVVEVVVYDNRGQGSRYVPVDRISQQAKQSILSIKLKKPVKASSVGHVNITVEGNMETVTSEALFKTVYADTQIRKNSKVTVGTQLRPTNARRLFACFDEPEYKTPFKLVLIRPASMVALSNTPIESTEERDNGLVSDRFKTTPVMSTFSLGFVLGDLKQLANSTLYKDEYGNNLELRVWGRPEYLQALEGVNEKVARVFSELASFWRVPLPLTKLDVVALPGYQGNKPSDSFGLIVFKESDLSSISYLQLAQELSYQWLSALATPVWWSHAHLNKALVGYLAAETAFKINNGSEMEGKWPMTVLYSLYYEYSKRFPHSRITGMKQETASTKIELLFRMFNYTLGSNTFNKGLRTFLESRKYKTFTGDDIWEALKTVAYEDNKISSDFSIKTIADTWIDKERLPLVTVERDYEKNTVSLKQKVYLRERPHDVPNAEQMFWWTPIIIARSDKLNFTETTPLVWMKDRKELVLKNMPDKNNFIIVNPEEIAPFPVNYDIENWNLLSQYLQSEKRTLIPELTRAKLLHDAWNLAYAGELSFATAFNMTLFLKNERNHLVWDPVFTMIDHLGRHMCECIQGKFQAYIRSLLSPLYEELVKDEKEDEESGKKNLRSLTRTFLCQAGYEPCVKEAQAEYSKWMKATDPDEGNPISNQNICPVFKWGTMEEWEFGLQRVIQFPQSRQQSERTYLLKTLAGCPKDEDKIIRLLNLTVLEDHSSFTETDVFLIFSMLSGGPKGYTTLFHFLDTHWDLLKDKLINKTNLWDSLINSATSHFTTKDGLEAVQKLYESHKGEFGSAERLMERSIKNIKEEVQWSEENLPVIESWLNHYLSCTEAKDETKKN